MIGLEADFACLNIIKNKPSTLVLCMYTHYQYHEKSLILLDEDMISFAGFHPYVLSLSKRLRNESVMKGSSSYSVRAILLRRRWSERVQPSWILLSRTLLPVREKNKPFAHLLLSALSFPLFHCATTFSFTFLHYLSLWILLSRTLLPVREVRRRSLAHLLLHTF